jgi:hypothetical protein
VSESQGSCQLPNAQQPIDPELEEIIDGLKGKEGKKTLEIMTTLLVLELYEKQGLGIPDCRFFDGVIPAYPGLIAPLMEAGKDINACANALPRIAGAISCDPEPPIEFGCNFLGARQLAFDEKKRVIPLLNRSLDRPIGIMDRIVAVKSIGVGTKEGTILRHHSHCYCRDGKWFMTDRLPEVWATFIMAVRAQTLARDTWSVRVRLSDATPSVNLFTDPRGVLNFFRFREIPAGKARRDALIHWVQDHWRRKPEASEDADAVIHVREHMRGQRVFRWHGMEVEICIPEARKEQGP